MHPSSPIIDIDWLSIALTDYVFHPIITMSLCLLSVFVVLGNSLVVSAIWHEHQLHSVTNYLIASLAAADCLVGAVVMPFSIISEIIIGSWTFGETWCDLWHSFDVLASTASIMNLCAISLDRYLAITQPISYPSRMTTKRVALLIASLWMCSSLISFPAILWWRAVGQSPLQRISSSTFTTMISPLGTNTNFSTTKAPPLILSEAEDSKFRCVFTDDFYYLLFSSFISFYGPLCVMLYAYIRIYTAAVQQTKFLKLGSKEVVITRNKKKKSSRHLSEYLRDGTKAKSKVNETSCTGLSEMENYDKQHLVLRVHRGGGGGTNSSMRKSSDCDAANIKINNIDDMRRRDDQLQNHTPRTANQHLSDEESTIQTEFAQQIDDLHQSTTSRSDRFFINSVRRNSSSPWKNRSDLTSSKRDRFKVECQRFDSSPFESERADALEVIILPETTVSKNDISEKSLIKERLSTSLNKTEDRFKADSNELKRKPCLASMVNRSTTIDVSILNCSSQSSRGSERLSISNNNSAQLHLIKSENYSPKSSSFTYNGSIMGMNEACCSSSLEKSKDRSNKILECESMSESSSGSSSGSSSADGGCINGSSSSDSGGSSYGTGSLASVIVKLPKDQKNATDKSQIKEDSCDSNRSLRSNPRVRRALSFGDARHKELAPRRNKAGDDETAADEQLERSLKTKHRASWADSFSKNSPNNANSKTSITLNIRSWVKLPLNKSKKHKNHHDNQMIKPPPSLMPLIKMNSDTSLDSSINTTRSSRGASKKRLRQVSDEGSSSEFDIGESAVVKDKAEQKVNFTTKGNGEAVKQLDKNLTFKDLENRKESNKRQILYYNSDKLIQSLVDLNAISYIDCAISPKTSMKAAGSESKTKSKFIAKAGGEANKLDLDSSEKIQLTDNSKVDLPRQYKSVGKRLSKLAKERKAAKTLGIVVGVFILCWLPFFMVNIVVAFCGSNCIYKLQIFFPIVTWLGWLNSAMNPVIYACWSRDFRRAFRRVLCSWVEFICPYDGVYIATKLKLKKCSAQDAYLNRNASSVKGNTSSATVRSGISSEGR